ncbi:hypothetical protein [Paenibacillus alginolyticus]|uniref:Uncharacterized protein n=1 Tax=Paenibacillus alginolyticus TaxID=59839 RepID=A0ABT4GAH9_9BACL|nr:hypothetical protein [Paenibacillus alginolyticus]MCY9693162.1 hypothetical protein [Paenibacillus alginolyticus]MEC0144543.1 hypothetical protein [Paenibacillus alginolyticus]
MKQADEYAKLLSQLEERTVTQTKDGYEFAVKRIPDSDAAGELDFRVLDVQQKQAAK